ncbi:hypothetical protein AB1286_18970 [Trinickia sp. NRRL B-1857]|uniref:hypothetical protein n=1 Tax=Trinickia sp. NRRL B-1857 TaxID=3162879 RepID=UPI003D28715F
MAYMLDPLGVGRAFPSTLNPLSDRPVPNPDPNPYALPAPDTLPATGTTVGDANLVWSANGDGQIETATIKNGQSQIVGQIAVDSKNNSVSVTRYDPSTGKPALDNLTGKLISSTFHYDSEGHIVNDGNLASEDIVGEGNGTSDEMTGTLLNISNGTHSQLVTLQGRNGDVPPISVDIAPDLQNPSNHSLSAFVVMHDQKPNGDIGGAVLYMKPGSLQDDGSASTKQVSTWYESSTDDATQTAVEKTYVTPAPNITPTPTTAPAQHTDHGWVSNLFSWL